jgi:hypothetical protein
MAFQIKLAADIFFDHLHNLITVPSATFNTPSFRLERVQ